jgi:hypothetical protein
MAQHVVAVRSNAPDDLSDLTDPQLSTDGVRRVRASVVSDTVRSLLLHHPGVDIASIRVVEHGAPDAWWVSVTATWAG